MDEAKESQYEATGRWEVRYEFDSNWERPAPVLVDPKGIAHCRWCPDGRSEAEGYADTYNMNEDKAAEFRQCPYCTTGCPWCG